MSELKMVEMYEVEVDGKAVIVGSKAEALALQNRAAYVERAQAYIDGKGFEDKKAAAKLNVVVDFLAYEASVADEEE